MLAQQKAVAQEDNEDVVVGKYRKIHSEILDEDRLVLVHLPRGYEGTSISYPVIYLLYADQVTNYYAEALHVTTLLSINRIPQAIVVGIANTDRYRDYLPVRPDGSPGGAGNFLRFMVEELIPYIHANYRTADFRILVAPQAGGVFGTYTLMERPETFDAYIVNNEFYRGANRDSLIERAESFFPGTRSLPAYFLMTCEANEPQLALDYAHRFAEIIGSHTPEGFRWKVDIVEPTGDFLAPTGLREGLVTLFRGYEFPEHVQVQRLKDIQTHYDVLSERYGFSVAIPDLVLTQQADFLTDRGAVDEALTVLEYLIVLYPHSVNGYWRLANIHREQGNTELAVRYYRKCLELNPNVIPAREWLERLERQR
jgi:hypothetical protein